MQNPPLKSVTLGEQTQESLLKGADTIASVVGSTLGPMGRTVIIETPYGATTVTKDGVTVAKHLALEDPVENLAVSIIKQAASKTSSTAGDGTTTSTVIASALYKKAAKLISLGIPAIEIKKKLEELLHKTRLFITKMTTEVSDDDILKIATISANNDEAIGSLVQSAYSYVGKDGLISMTESKTGSTYVELLPGASINKGYASPTFMTNPAKQEAVLDKPLIFITEDKLRDLDSVISILEVAHSQKRPLLIIADSIDGQALAVLALNKLKGVMSIAAVEAPSFGDNRAEILKDLAALTSATLYSSTAADRYSDLTPHHFGSADQVVISKDRTIFINPDKDIEQIESRASAIKESLANDSLNPFLVGQLQKRLADLTAKVAIIHVGAPTESELIEVKDRVDDALRATSAAVAKGYVVGGGIALMRASKNINASSPIEEAFASALLEPMRVIVSNAGKNFEVAYNEVASSDREDYGFNAKSLSFSNLKEDGVIDPTLVVLEAVTNAVSAANMLILSNTTLTNVDRTPPYTPAPVDYA